MHPTKWRYETILPHSCISAKVYLNFHLQMNCYVSKKQRRRPIQTWQTPVNWLKWIMSWYDSTKSVIFLKTLASTLVSGSQMNRRACIFLTSRIDKWSQYAWSYAACCVWSTVCTCLKLDYITSAYNSTQSYKFSKINSHRKRQELTGNTVSVSLFHAWFTFYTFTSLWFLETPYCDLFRINHRHIL